jgi:hypothetical protein|tara:strand:+ start:103 stop:744 length:642 start_codon:yes stop_codon:yes gene_type:complete
MSYSSARRAREHGKRAVVTVDVAGADGTPVPHTIPRALFSASLQERAAKRSRADKALRAARAAPPRPPAVDNNTIVVVAPRNPQRRERRKRKPKKKAPAPAATNAVDRKADGWWRSLEGIDPISLEPLKLLPIPPFTLRSANLTGASHSHFFDAQVRCKLALRRNGEGSCSPFLMDIILSPLFIFPLSLSTRRSSPHTLHARRTSQIQSPASR